MNDVFAGEEDIQSTAVTMSRVSVSHAAGLDFRDLHPTTGQRKVKDATCTEKGHLLPRRNKWHKVSVYHLKMLLAEERLLTT